MELKLGFCSCARPAFSLLRNDRKSQTDFQLGAKRFHDLYSSLRSKKIINPLLKAYKTSLVYLSLPNFDARKYLYFPGKCNTLLSYCHHFREIKIVACCPDIITFRLLSTLGVVKVGNKKADPPVDIALVGLK